MTTSEAFQLLEESRDETKYLGCGSWSLWRNYSVIYKAGGGVFYGHCGYWVSLRGQPETMNARAVTVELPRSNQFTVEAVVSMFQRISNGGLP